MGSIPTSLCYILSYGLSSGLICNYKIRFIVSLVFCEANVMPIQVQVNSQILLSAHKLQQRGLGPCTDLELQFQPHPKPLRCVTLLFWEGQEAF